MVNKIYKKIAEKLGFENPVQISVPYWLFEEKGLKNTDIMNLKNESKKAVEVEDQYGNSVWLPKSQIEIKEI